MSQQMTETTETTETTSHANQEEKVKRIDFEAMMQSAQHDAAITVIGEFKSYGGTVRDFLDELPDYAQEIVMGLPAHEFVNALGLSEIKAKRHRRTSSKPAAPPVAPDEHKEAVLKAWGTNKKSRAVPLTTRDITTIVAPDPDAEDALDERKVRNAINALIADGKVRKEGDKRGAVYHYVS